jgi:hypothetical protein
MAVKVDINAKGIEPSGVDTHGRSGALLVMGAALAMAEGTAGVGSADGANKATTAAPEALGHGVWQSRGSTGAGPKGHRMTRPGVAHRCERASERSERRGPVRKGKG